MILRQPPTCHPRTPVKVALLSGLSDPLTCALGPQETAFLRNLAVPEAWKVYWNFPYVPCRRERRPPPLWLASLQNFRQFLLASRPSYRDAARRHWQSMASSAERLVVITFSCGLEIINHCFDATPARAAIHLLALGPVAWQSPRFPCTLVQGSRDYISKLFFRKCQVVLSGGGHMNYVDDPRVSQIANEILCGSTSPSPAPAATFPSGGSAPRTSIGEPA